jgi:hypothetical protein
MENNSFSYLPGDDFEGGTGSVDLGILAVIYVFKIA